MKALRSIYVLAFVAIASCATRAPSSPQWSNIEGCWFERSGEIWPAYMSWRRDPDHPGGYLGDWHREEAQGDVDRVNFALTPVGDQMQLCDRRAICIGASPIVWPLVMGMCIRIGDIARRIVRRCIRCC